MSNNIKCSKLAAFWSMAAFCAPGVFLTLPALGDTESTGAVSINFIESGTNELTELAEFNKEKKKTGVSQYYFYAAEKPQYFSLSRLSKLSTASIESVIDAGLSSKDDSVNVVKISSFDKARHHLADFKLFALPEVADAIKTYYQQHPGFVWVTNGRINEKAVQALDVLSSAEEYGLNSSDYDVILRNPDLKLDTSAPSFANHIEFEMVLSSKLLTYILDGTRGRINPNKISRYHDLPRKKVDLVGGLADLAAATDVAEYLEGVHPDNQQFRMLVKEMKKLRLSNPSQANRVKITIQESIRPGESSPELPKIVAALQKSSSFAVVTKHVNTLRAYEGSLQFTPDLVQLVRDFQMEKKLKVDGIIGKQTVHALEKAVSWQKIDKVRFAMERLRWLPSDLGSRRVFVNQPAFEAEYWEDGTEKLSMRVVIGKQGAQTSFFYDEIERVVYNPYWSLPRRILREEYAQKFIDDPTYFDRMGFQVISQRGNPIPSHVVDWHNVAANKKTVRVRQLPGKKNLLGELKIMFPNVHAIYMHDTQDKHLFEEDVRAFSHGCVRLQHPREMAAAILGTDSEYVAEKINDNKNKSESVEDNIPIYISYFTAWPDENGEVSYYADVYERDDYLRFAELKTDAVRQLN